MTSLNLKSLARNQKGFIEVYLYVKLVYPTHFEITQCYYANLKPYVFIQNQDKALNQNYLQMTIIIFTQGNKENFRKYFCILKFVRLGKCKEKQKSKDSIDKVPKSSKTYLKGSLRLSSQNGL